MSVPPPNRPGAPRPAGIGATYTANQTLQRQQTGYIPVMAAGHTEVITTAPTLGQFWRSDVLRTTTRRRPRWAGMAAFWLSLAAIGFLLIGSLTGIELVRAIALPLSAVAGFFGLIAVIARIGRALGFVGLILALVGNIFVLSWIVRLFS
ncbi:hypothetical protein ACFPJ4_10015 [Lysinimonas soli]|uniref:DUF4190 domain-containing protein n=1 Tax=Lysinimonas soli TaxID=1074233 RepID=A0ABW0NQB9_9MICO